MKHLMVLCALSGALGAAPSLPLLGLSQGLQAPDLWQGDEAGKELAVCFEVKEDLEVRALAAYAGAAQGDFPFLLALHAEGPAGPGEMLAEASGVAPKAGAWMLGLLDGHFLKKGERACLVIRPDLLRGGSHPVGKPSDRRFAAFQRVGLEPALGLRAWEKNGAGWTACPSLPLHALLGRGKRIQGLGWKEEFALPIHGNGTPADDSDDAWQAQVFHFDCVLKARSVRARVRKVGQPRAPLKWALFSHDFKAHQAKLVFEAELARPSKLKDGWAWVEARFPENPDFEGYPPECHYVGLLSESGAPAGAGCGDCYEVSGLRLAPGLELVQELGFNGGAHRGRASSSRGGAHWHDDFEADLHLGILAPACPPKAAPQAPRLLPTPAPLP